MVGYVLRFVVEVLVVPRAPPLEEVTVVSRSLRLVYLTSSVLLRFAMTRMLALHLDADARLFLQQTEDHLEDQLGEGEEEEEEEEERVVEVNNETEGGEEHGKIDKELLYPKDKEGLKVKEEEEKKTKKKGRETGGNKSLYEEVDKDGESGWIDKQDEDMNEKDKVGSKLCNKSVGIADLLDKEVEYLKEDKKKKKESQQKELETKAMQENVEKGRKEGKLITEDVISISSEDTKEGVKVLIESKDEIIDENAEKGKTNKQVLKSKGEEKQSDYLDKLIIKGKNKNMIELQNGHINDSDTDNLRKRRECTKESNKQSGEKKTWNETNGDTHKSNNDNEQQTEDMESRKLKQKKTEDFSEADLNEGTFKETFTQEQPRFKEGQKNHGTESKNKSDILLPECRDSVDVEGEDVTLTQRNSLSGENLGLEGIIEREKEEEDNNGRRKYTKEEEREGEAYSKYSKEQPESVSALCSGIETTSKVCLEGRTELETCEYKVQNRSDNEDKRAGAVMSDEQRGEDDRKPCDERGDSRKQTVGGLPSRLEAAEDSALAENETAVSDDGSVLREYVGNEENEGDYYFGDENSVFGDDEGKVKGPDLYSSSECRIADDVSLLQLSDEDGLEKGDDFDTGYMDELDNRQLEDCNEGGSLFTPKYFERGNSSIGKVCDGKVGVACEIPKIVVEELKSSPEGPNDAVVLENIPSISVPNVDGKESILPKKNTGTVGTDEIDASIAWVKNVPPPLPGPKCTCKVPGTPPWKPVHSLMSSSTCATSDSSYTTTVLSLNHEMVTVKLRRPRSASFNPETALKKERHFGYIPRDVGGEIPADKDPLQSSGLPPGMTRSNSKELKEKRPHILRSWSFWGRPSPSDNHSLLLAPPPSSPSPGFSCSSSPLCSYSAFANLTTPRRWSRVLGEKRKSVQSCIYPGSPSSMPVGGGGNLTSRVRSEPIVDPEKCSEVKDEVPTTPQRRFSKALSEKRKSVRSCIFPDAVDEDYAPYAPAKSPDVHTPTPQVQIDEPVSPSKVPELRSGISWSPLSNKETSDSQTTKPDGVDVSDDSTYRKTSSPVGKRPQSLVIIPESQNEKLPPSTSKRPQKTLLQRPQSLFIPPDIIVPRRDPRLTPPESHSIHSCGKCSCAKHSDGGGGIGPYRQFSLLHSPQIQSAPVHSPLLHFPLPYYPQSCSPQKPQQHSPFKDVGQSSQRPTVSWARRERRKKVRSWSFSPSMGIGPLEALKGLRAQRASTPTSQSLKSRFYLPKYATSVDSSTATEPVVFPWRRGDQNRSSGRSSPAPYDTTNHSPSSSPCYSQSPACGLNEEVINGTCEVAGEVKQKDGVWRRSRGGVVVSRTSRREKASSSPVFRRASLSHSEWDIRRPWSHLYSEREAAKLSQSVCRLAMSGEEGVGGVEGSPDGEDGPRSLPYMPSPTHNTSSEGMFQKFKKSLSLRLTKKGSRSESPGPVGSVGPSSQSAPVCQLLQGPDTNQVESQTLPRRRGSISKEEDNKSSFLFGHPLFRSSKERRRARLKDARANKCNSGDSGDSGIELVTGPGHVTVLDVTSSQPPDLDVTAGNYLDPAFVASLSEEGGIVGGCGRELNPRAVRRTHSDVGRSGGRGSVPYCRQLSSPQPLKLRPAHRLPQHTGSLHRHRSSLKRSKGSSHLRRSISQPLDLDKAYDTPLSSLRKCRSPGSSNRRQQRRPSAGNILNDDNTTSEDEIGMSDSEDFRNDLKRSLEDDEDMIVYAEALWDHVTLDSEELVFKAGDLITVIDSSDKDWWWGRISNRAGWFPAAFVRLLVNQEEHQDSRRQEDTQTHGPARKLSLSGLSHDQIRTNVINEIITTERDFVKHLRDVVEGYLRQVRKRPDMFNDEKVSSIFGNMEALYHFQSNFLKELEQCIEWQEPHKSCIGASFIRNREKFEIYSEYCNNHPMAVSSLQELYQDQKYIHFFEACRLLQEMIDISLDGFLLTPVQKICKYPLQLQELLKYTKPDHPDYSSVQGALEAMRDVALLVNERKRRMECLEKIASWQITVEGWEGPELLEESSQLIYQGEATKGAGGSWPKEVTLFLFDHQLVYCKRDLLKRNTFVYRGRLNLDMCEVVDLPDGKDSSLNINAHNAWKIHSLGKNKWYVFSCKTSTEKKKWMEAFRRERELVAADENAGFVVAEKAKHLAKVAARNQKNRPKRPRTTKSHKRVQAMTYAQAELLVNVDPEVRSNSLPSGVQPPEGKKKGMWFSFGGHKKGRGSGRNLSQIQHHPV